MLGTVRTVGRASIAPRTADGWGLDGMLPAVPPTVVLRIVLDNLPATRPIARLMGVG
jgi:hypothetical protein